jgi:hypothetical protein
MHEIPEVLQKPLRASRRSEDFRSNLTDAGHLALSAIEADVRYFSLAASRKC